MVNVLKPLKSRPYKNFRQANVLLAVLLISTLSSGFVFHYGFVLRNDVYKAQILKSVHDKKQVLLLAYQAYRELKLRAEVDNCVTYEKGGKFILGNSEIKCELEKNSGYCVKGIFQAKTPFACCFEKQGLRKPLAEVMQGDNCLEMTNDAWELVQQRWKALKCDELLPPSLFPPLIEKMDVFRQCINGTGIKDNITVYFFNPYNCSLKKEKFNIEVNGEQMKVNESSNYKHSFTLENEQNIQLKIKNGATYDISANNGSRSFKISGDRKQGFSFDKTGTAKPTKAVAWRSMKKASERSVENDISLLNEKLPTKSWLDKINACFFNYEQMEPYDKVNNFKNSYTSASTTSITELRNYFWNEVVVNSDANVFCFNGPKAYIEEKLCAYGLSQNQASVIAEKIVENQPYTSATSFLETIISYEAMGNLLPSFENLSHRTETFKIEAWYLSYKCEIWVQREAKGETERAWKIVRICWHKLK